MCPLFDSVLVLKRCSFCFGALRVLKVVHDWSARCADVHLHVVLLLKRSSYFRKCLFFKNAFVTLVCPFHPSWRRPDSAWLTTCRPWFGWPGCRTCVLSWSIGMDVRVSSGLRADRELALGNESSTWKPWVDWPTCRPCSSEGGRVQF